MSKFTPGPWTVEDRRRAALKNIRIVAGSHEVAEVSDVHQRDYQGSFRGDHAAADAVDAVGLANARLIAAAPCLLAACIECLKVVDDCYRSTGHIQVAETSHQRLAIEAAIRKATGE